MKLFLHLILMALLAAGVGKGLEKWKEPRGELRYDLV
jgi:hypothetical protein